MYVYLIRHAHAGDRGQGIRDRYRPLTDKGHRRANELVDLFANVEIDLLISSPATRCRQTLEPLGQSLNREVLDSEELLEGSDIVDAIAYLGALKAQRVVACSHGDMIPAIIEQLALAGVLVSGQGCEKGSIWVIERDSEQQQWLKAHYLSPIEALRHQ